MLDTLKTFDSSKLSTVFAGAATADLAPTVRGRSIRTKYARQRFVTIRNSRRAADQVRRLPKLGESLHLLLAPNAFAVFDLLPAIIELAGQNASEVWLSTLGIASRHIAALDRLLIEGRIRRCGLLLSHYFSRVDKGEFEDAVAVFKRHKMPIRECRSHAKIIAVRFGRDRHIVVESSGNLRSCRAAETATIFDDVRLFRWHRTWIRELLEDK